MANYSSRYKQSISKLNILSKVVSPIIVQGLVYVAVIVMVIRWYPFWFVMGLLGLRVIRRRAIVSHFKDHIVWIVVGWSEVNSRSYDLNRGVEFIRLRCLVVCREAAREVSTLHSLRIVVVIWPLLEAVCLSLQNEFIVLLRFVVYLTILSNVQRFTAFMINLFLNILMLYVGMLFGIVRMDNVWTFFEAISFILLIMILNEAAVSFKCFSYTWFCKIYFFPAFFMSFEILKKRGFVILRLLDRLSLPFDIILWQFSSRFNLKVEFIIGLGRNIGNDDNIWVESVPLKSEASALTV